MPKKTIKAIVEGKVQGVFYRVSTKRKAESLGIVGYAKNLNNGCVEVIATGRTAQVNSLLAWLNEGPELANVASVSFEDVEIKDFDGFSTR